MSDRKTPEERAREYANGYGHGATIPKRMHKDICDGIALVQHVAYLAGRADFIKNELPKLLEMARIGYGGEFDYEIPDLLAMAVKGEV